MMRELQIHTIIHCGDLTSPHMINYFDGFQIFLAFGNGDYQTGEIAAQLYKLSPDNKSNSVIKINIDNCSIAAIHGNAYLDLQKMIQSGMYQYIFTGHTHVQNDVVYRQTRVINPGALHTKGYHVPTYVIFDTASRQLEFFRFNP